MGEKKEVMTIRMPFALKEQVHTEAAKRGVSVNAYILLLIRRDRLNQME